MTTQTERERLAKRIDAVTESLRRQRLYLDKMEKTLDRPVTRFKVIQGGKADCVKPSRSNRN